MPYHEVTEPVCVCANCAEFVGEEALSQRTQLGGMAFDLQERDYLLEHAKLHGGEELEELVQRAFDAGFSFARNVGEYQAKRSVEPAALKAHSILAAASAGGLARAASTKAHREAVINEMARLIDEGKSASSAALIAANRGIGKSQAANQKAWQRHKPGT
ncbi:hypothetical protein PAF17_18885 [Paracoccus sp. Z330]|uniref:Uncharacterized protein n=1 Tax=Paracoccus onchidii TaxID=3017813 RepID=A0ABT4ZJK9_9RHOB|nr:hypothetical protein [Paracoccus onchidii]MDB6179540.1 hypothetical protein [Paracoccus onchidii]